MAPVGGATGLGVVGDGAVADVSAAVFFDVDVTGLRAWFALAHTLFVRVGSDQLAFDGNFRARDASGDLALVLATVPACGTVCARGVATGDNVLELARGAILSNAFVERIRFVGISVGAFGALSAAKGSDGTGVLASTADFASCTALGVLVSTRGTLGAGLLLVFSVITTNTAGLALAVSREFGTDGSHRLRTSKARVRSGGA
jgi:hypothetical protein